MTKKLRVAAQQALEALEFEADGWECPPPKTTAAITALREALAEPEPRNQCAEVCERAKLCAICARGIVEAEHPAKCEHCPELLAALKKVAQALDWHAHGCCRGFDDGPLMSSSEAVELAKRTIARHRDMTSSG